MNMEKEPVNGIPVGAGSLTETDLTLDYSHKVPGVDVLGFSAGAIYYSYSNIHASPDGRSVWRPQCGRALSPRPSGGTTTSTWSMAATSSSAVGHTIEKLKEWQDRCYCDLQVGASLGWAPATTTQGYFGVDQTALNDLTLTVGLPITFGKLTIRPTLGYTTLISKPIRTGYAQSGGTRNDDFWGGVGLVYSF